LLGAFLKAGINEFEISIELCVFDTHIDIFQEKKLLVHNSTFCNLKMQRQKKLYIFKHFSKSKKLFFLPISIIFRVIPIEIPKNV
jgi:hypothetical protein